MRLIRVFPRITKATPRDDLARFGPPDLIDEADEVHVSDRAFLIFDGTKEVWLPKALVEHDAGEGTFAMPEWLAGEKGLI